MRTALFLVATLLLGTRPALAEWGGPDREEQALLHSLRTDKLIRAREQAEKILARRPDSIIGRYGLAMVFHDEEANLPRALYHIRLAEQQLIKRFGRRPTDPQARVWHRKILEEEATSLGEMDRREEQLSVMDRHDDLYRPKMDRFRIWPLMKLHRFEEARALARRVSLSENLNDRISGLNGMIAIESERLLPRACFDVGMKAVIATSYQSCILDQNTAEAAFAVYRFDEAENLALRSIQATIEDCPSTAYPHLANLYLLRADFQKAMQAIKSSREQPIERRYRQQFEMSNSAWLTRLLYTLGRFDEALDLARRVLLAPDRVGMTSFSDEVMRVVYTVDYHATLLARMEALREQAAARPLLRRIPLWTSVLDLQRKAWGARRRVARLLSGSNDLVHLLRPYLKPQPPWNAGALIDVVGGGVLLQALAEVRARETMKDKTSPYLDAVEGEIAYGEGRWARALELGRAAIAGLPRDEVLLRGRTEAWAGEAARRLGQTKEAEGLLLRALQHFPTALRILQVRLPARVLAGNSQLARSVGQLLLSSPRLAPDGSGPFVIRVTGGDRDLRLCLELRTGRRHGCATPDPELLAKAANNDERVALALDSFHRKVFAPKIDLTQRDINSLDGSSIRGDADEVLRDVLGN